MSEISNIAERPVHVLHVVRDLDLSSGGPSISIPALVAAIARKSPNDSQTILFQDRGSDYVRAASEQNVCMRTVTGGLAAPVRMRRVVAELSQRERELSIHLHGLWSPSLHGVARFARQSRIPYLISPRGMLSPWCLKHHPVRKRLAWNLYQSRDLERSSLIHATSEAEADDILAVTKRAPVVVVSNGCDQPPSFADPFVDAEVYCPSPLRLAVAISRLHPVKGLQELMSAWQGVRPVGWHLAIIGPDENEFRSVLEKQRTSLGLERHVSLHDAVDASRKWQVLAQAELFILPSKSENFGQAIAESLASGTPVITTTGTPWRVIADRSCGWWIEPNQAALEDAIRDATNRPAAELADMGARGRELIRQEFSWESVAEQMQSIYRHLVHHQALAAGLVSRRR